MGTRLFWGYAPIPPTPLCEARETAGRVAAKVLDALKKTSGVTGVLTHGEGGKPFLSPAGRAEVSITHTDTLAFAGILLGDREKPAGFGMDAEEEGRLSPAKAKQLAARFFAPYEKARTEPLTGAPLVAAFLQIFTAKEAFGKYRGDGLAPHLRGTDTLSPHFEEEEGVRFHSLSVAGHCITFCLPAQADAEISEVSFSPSSFLE